MLYKFCSFSKGPIIIKLVYFLYYISISGIQTFFSVMLSEYGLNDTEIGIAYAVMSLAALISPICFGYIADKTKKTKIVLIISVVMSLSAHCAPFFFLVKPDNTTEKKALKKLNFLPTNQNSHYLDNQTFIKTSLFRSNDVNFDQHNQKKENENLEPTYLTFKLFLSLLFMFPCSFFDQGSKILIDAAAYKMINSMRKDGEILQWGQQKVFGSIGFALSSIITGALSTYLSTQFLKTMTQVGVTLFLGLILLLLLLFGFKCMECKNEVHVKSNLRRIIKNRYIMLTIISHTVVYFLTYMTKNFIPLFILDLRGSKLYIGIYMTLYYLFEIISTPLAEKVIHLMGGNERVIWWSLLTHGLNRIVLSFTESPYVVLVFSCSNGAVNGIYNPSIYNTIAYHAEEAAISVSLSVLTTGSRLGVLVSNAISGYILSKYNYKILIQSSAYGYFAWLVIFTILSYIIMKRPRNEYQLLAEERIELINDDSTDITWQTVSDASKLRIG